MTEESYTLQMYSWGTCLGPEKETIPRHGVISGREGGREAGYSTGKNAVKSCRQWVLIGGYFGFWF